MTWWGYVHVTGSLHLKRFFDNQDLDDAYDSEFVDRVVSPFEANNRDDAWEILKKSSKE